MTINRRTLTVSFARSITSGVPNTMEVAVNPLSEPNAPEMDISLVGGPQVQQVLLANQTNTVSFELVPSDHPDLDQRMLYRIGWRERFLGRQYTHDFAMPDSDVSFADLDDLGAVLGGETYVQWSDRGVPGGVAGLNDEGQVIDAEGNPVTGTGGADGPLQIFTASNGVRKVAVDLDDYTVYDFQLDSTAARKWHGNVIPTTGNFGTVVHNLDTIHVLVVVRDASSRLPVANAVARPNLDGNSVTIEFDSPPSLGQFTATVIG